MELTSLDTRFEHTRTRNSSAELNLLTSITERNILDPIQVIPCENAERYAILDGFKRYRCALKLKIKIVPADAQRVLHHPRRRVDRCAHRQVDDAVRVCSRHLRVRG